MTHLATSQRHAAAWAAYGARTGRGRPGGQQPPKALDTVRPDLLRIGAWTAKMASGGGCRVRMVREPVLFYKQFGFMAATVQTSCTASNKTALVSGPCKPASTRVSPRHKTAARHHATPETAKRILAHTPALAPQAKHHPPDSSNANTRCSVLPALHSPLNFLCCTHLHPHPPPPRHPHRFLPAPPHCQSDVPVIDLSLPEEEAAQQVRAACTHSGFMYGG